MNTVKIIALSVLVAGLTASTAIGQMVIPVRNYERGWECWSIEERDIDILVQDQVAFVTITDVVSNTCYSDVEIQYLFPLPPAAAVDQFTLIVDGRELSGHILDAQEARQIYNDIVRRRKDPGLLEYAGAGLYRSSAFPLGPGKSAKLILHYTLTCKKDGDVVELWYPMSSGRTCTTPVGRFHLSADIESTGDISSVYSPSLDLKIDRKTPGRVRVDFEARGYRPLSDFQLFYEVARDEMGATFLTYWPNRNEDGYYMMMVSPNPRLGSGTVMPKDIVIVLDHSGSMSGDKIRQARDAVQFILDNLNRNDAFNLIVYNDRVSSCFASLRPATRENVDEAVERLRRTDAEGGTNIYQALASSVQQLNGYRRSGGRPSYIIFLTDGLPTVGNVREDDILQNTMQENQAHTRIFAFGVGYDVNVRLLDKLVNQNHGRSAYVKPNESIETKVSALYKRIRNPLVTNVTAEIAGFNTRDDCPTELGDLFEGDQIVRVGRIYPEHSGSLDQAEVADCPVTLTISGEFRNEVRQFEYPIDLNIEDHSARHRFVEKLWATRRIGQLLEDIQLHGRVEEVVDELIRLSKKYGIVTPYTSYLADENRDLTAQYKIRQQVVQESRLRAGNVSGPQAQMDAAARSQAMQSNIADMLAKKPGFKADPSGAIRLGASSVKEYESGEAQEINSIRLVGNVTLYKKGDTWQTADVTHLDPVRDRGQFRIVKRFSDEYFALIRENTEEENKVFASQMPNEKLAIMLRATAYLIE
jgi:Ca-activated chloride channel homolog